MKFLSISLVVLALMPHAVAKELPVEKPDEKPAAHSPFIIDASQQKRKKSKRWLKEDMGEEIETALQQCAQVQESLGRLQTELACLQTRLLSVGKNVLENSGTVRSATRKDLFQGIHALKLMAKTLSRQVVMVTRSHDRIRSADVFKG